MTLDFYVKKPWQPMLFIEPQPIEHQNGASPPGASKQRRLAPVKQKPKLISSGRRSERIELDFDNLSGFELVSNQYEHFGVRFSEAIALQPSHPAFPYRQGSFVLMPLGERTEIIAHFHRSICQTGAFVVCPKPVRLIAFDASGEPIARISTKQIQVSQGAAEIPEALPRQKLEIQHPNIAKVLFGASTPFILDDFFFYQN